MNARRLASLAVLLLLGLLVAWVANHTYWDEQDVPAPWRGEAARNPFYATQRFAAALGAHTHHDALPAAPPRNAVIYLSAWNWGLSSARRQRLEKWVEAGGRLLVDRTLIAGDDAFERWSGIVQRNDADATQEQRQDDEPPCRTLTEAHSAASLSVCGIARDTHLQVPADSGWELRDADGTHAVRVAKGIGSVTFIDAEPFAWRELFSGQHPELFVAATQLRRGDDLYFVTEQQQESLLLLAWRYGAPVLVLLLTLIAVWIWRSSIRFGPLAAPAQAARRSLAEQIRGTGRFALRYGAGEALYTATVRALREAASRHTAPYDGQPAELAGALAARPRRKPQELRSAIALLETARRRILIANTRSKHGR
jgi:hypothetical protein